jgi:hypothetical protein
MPLVSGWGFSSVECSAHSIHAYRVFFSPADGWPARDQLRPVPSRGSQTPSKFISLATFYLTPALANPNFLIEEAVLGGSLAYKKMWNVAQIMGNSFCAYRSSYQGGAEPPHQEVRGRGHRRNLLPPGYLHRIKPRQEIGKSPRACHHCNPERLFGLRMLVCGPPFRDLTGTLCRRHALRIGMTLQGPFLGLKAVDIRTPGPMTLNWE